MEVKKGHLSAATALQQAKQLDDYLKQFIETIRQNQIPYLMGQLGQSQVLTCSDRLATVFYLIPLDDPEERILLNPRLKNLLGFPFAEWTDPRFWSRQLHPEDHEYVLADIRKSFRNGNFFRSEYRLLTYDGQVAWVFDEGLVMREKAGKPCYMQGIMLDITDRKRMENELRRNEEKFRAIFERIAVGICLTDLDDRIVEANQEFQTMLGYGAEELHHKYFAEFVHPEDSSADLSFHKETPTGECDHYEMQKRFIRKDGGVIWSHLKVSLVRARSGEPKFTIRIVEDITERKRLESQFVQSQKMETVGRLAGGIAHDFNNLLTVIRGYNQLISTGLEEGNPLRANIEEVLKATERAEELTNRLLAFSRRQVLEEKIIDLNVLLRGLEKMLRRVIGEDIELTMVFAEDLGRIKTDPGQIENMILNLTINAQDAMPTGGKLTIETTNVELDDAYAGSHLSVIPGPYIRLTVSDTGCGMPPEVVEKIFDPFFTTKEKGEGTGLGLSTVYGIVKQSRGNIWVHSKLGHGTTFEIYFPRVEGELVVPCGQDENSVFPRGKETVLLAEDDQTVRCLAATVLTAHGYIVWHVSNGEEALRCAREHPWDKIHLLLTDVVMPQIGGKELFEKLRIERPNLKVLFTSGYIEKTITQHGLNGASMPLLQKPFSPKALVEKVRDILDGK
jgi:two-component system cell cycle sensor histidine kinase/response regulator CckA